MEKRTIYTAFDIALILEHRLLEMQKEKDKALFDKWLESIFSLIETTAKDFVINKTVHIGVQNLEKVRQKYENKQISEKVFFEKMQYHITGIQKVLVGKLQKVVNTDYSNFYILKSSVEISSSDFEKTLKTL